MSPLSGPLQITVRPFKLEFRFPFKIAHGIRTSTDAVFVKVQCDNMVGFGEATLPPYLTDNLESTIKFFQNPYLSSLKFPFSPADIHDELDTMIPGNYPAKAALDMALWNLRAAMEKSTVAELLGIESEKITPHFYTIGVSEKKEMAIKITHGLMEGFEYFKLKLDGVDDQRVINDYGLLCSKPFAVDANQGWKNLDIAQRMLSELEAVDCMLIEQPFDKADTSWTKNFSAQAHIPVLADEACQSLNDVARLAGIFSGVNIKLQKCGGITPALRMIRQARSLNLKVLIGCMSESSVGCNAAEALAPLSDWADLDGPWLIKNDPDMNTVFGN